MPAKTKSKSAKKAAKSTRPRVKVVSEKQAYKGPVFGVTTFEVQEPGGVRARRDVVTHSGSVVVIAVDEQRGHEPRVLLVRQYRHPARQYLWELPAGRRDEGEDAVEGAKRELIEETGLTARKWTHAFRFWASPGFLDETMDLFLARNLTHGEAQPEEDENIEMRWLPIPRAVRMCMNGEVQDAKTIAGVLWLARKMKL
ncbi:MAG TPA: NUDIX hydrolase [Terriglobales bacterium]|jgi:ADP-ribose pyrophosphatase